MTTAAPEGARERILRAAGELFYSKGIRNVGIDEVIARAGVAKASLYKHFESKDLLILEWVRQRHEEWRNIWVAEVIARAPDPRGQLLGIFEELEESFDDDLCRGCMFQNVMVELADADHPAHQASVEHKRAMRTFMQSLCAQAGAKDPEGLAYVLSMLLEGAIVAGVEERSPEPARRAREAAAQLLPAG